MVYEFSLTRDRAKYFIEYIANKINITFDEGEEFYSLKINIDSDLDFLYCMHAMFHCGYEKGLQVFSK